MLSKIGWTLGVVAILFLLLFLTDRLYHAITCKSAGLDRQHAIQSAQNLADAYGAQKAVNARFIFTSARFEDDTKWWSVSFNSALCELVVIVDECGAAEIGGVSAMSCKSQ